MELRARGDEDDEADEDIAKRFLQLQEEFTTDLVAYIVNCALRTISTCRAFVVLVFVQSGSEIVCLNPERLREMMEVAKVKGLLSPSVCSPRVTRGMLAKLCTFDSTIEDRVKTYIGLGRAVGTVLYEERLQDVAEATTQEARGQSLGREYGPIYGPIYGPDSGTTISPSHPVNFPYLTPPSPCFPSFQADQGVSTMASPSST